jgi:DNA-binding NarL/FixJ family response regulator
MSKTVLICDDVEEIRMLLTMAIEPYDDFQVVGEAADGNEAVVKCRELAPDVVLLDVNMPDKSGLQALAEIRDVVPSAKVIMFTGFESSVLGSAASDLGADDYIEKGTPLDEIVRRIRAVVAS